MTEEDIQKISKLLEMGGTMLAQHCSKCGAPIFRYQGKELCPLCTPSDRETQTKKESDVSKATVEPPGKMEAEAIEEIVITKVRQIALEMKTEKDPFIIKTQLECIKVGLEILSENLQGSRR